MRISVLDQSPISEGSTNAQALRNTLDLAARADALGYHRFWLAEHHGGAMAGPSPEALIGPVALSTERIRVGSGGVMLPHYSPLKVAETFALLDGLAPGRIDLGLGRAPGTDPMRAFALQRDRRDRAPDDFIDQLAELLAHLGRLPYPDEHPFRAFRVVSPEDAAAGAGPVPWLLGSSPQSAIWAGQLGSPTRTRTSSTPTARTSSSSTASGSSRASTSRLRMSSSRRGRSPRTRPRRPRRSRRARG